MRGVVDEHVYGPERLLDSIKEECNGGRITEVGLPSLSASTTVPNLLDHPIG
jgi:hypothetical protein